MDAVKVFHPVLTYFALTFAISWGGVLVVMGGSGGMAGTALSSAFSLGRGRGGAV